METSSKNEAFIKLNNSWHEVSNENHYTPFELKIAILVSVTFGITIVSIF